MDKKDSVYLSLPRMILNDGVLLLYLSVALTVIPALIWYEDPYKDLLLWIIPITSFSIYVTTWRYDRVCRTFMFGRELNGKVLNVARLVVIPLQGVEYSFQLDGKKMRHTAFHFDGGRARSFKEGDVISIMLNPDNPNYSILKDFYLN